MTDTLPHGIPGTHLRVLSKSFPMDTNMRRFRHCSKRTLHSCALDKSSLSKLEGLRRKDRFFLGLPTFYFKPTHNAKKSTRVQCVESAAHALLGSVRHKGCLSYQPGKGTCFIYLITANETDTFRISSLLYLNPTLHHNYASPDSIDTLSHCSPLDSANHRPVHVTDSHTNY